MRAGQSRDAGSRPRVLELSDSTAASFAARMFVLLGADVVKVERLPDGDPNRSREPQHAVAGGSANSVTFHYLNQGKRSFGLDFDDPAASRTLAGLAAWCDVALVDERFAADELVAAALDAAAPSVRTFVTPYGISGPHAEYAAAPGSVFALGGELSMLPGGLGYRMFPDAPPLLTRGDVAEFDGGVIGALVSLAALYHDVEEGTDVDVAATEACVSLNRWLVSHYDESGWIESRDTRSYPYAGMFACADGYVMLQPSTEGQWTSLVEMMGRPEWALKPEYATRAQRSEAGQVIAAELRNWVSTTTKESILHGGMQHGVPAAPFRDAAEVRNCPQFNGRDFFVPYGEAPDGGNGAAVPGLPFRLDPFGPPDLRRAPDLGEHTAEILLLLESCSTADAPTSGGRP